MRINHNIAAMVNHNSGRLNNVALNKSLEKLSTGLRINRSSDDAAGLSVSESLRAQVRGLAQAKRNAQDATAVMQIAEGAAAEITGMIQRMRELAVQAATDTNSTQERSYLNQEFLALQDEIDRIVDGTQHNGITLLDGYTANFHVGANDNGGAPGAGEDQIAVTLAALDTGTLGIDTGTADITDGTNALDAIELLDLALITVNNARSGMGAVMNRLEYATSNLASAEFNVQDAESRIRDVDFATETTNFTRSQILQQSATSMLAQANAVPQGVLQLLG